MYFLSRGISIAGAPWTFYATKKTNSFNIYARFIFALSKFSFIDIHNDIVTGNQRLTVHMMLHNLGAITSVHCSFTTQFQIINNIVMWKGLSEPHTNIINFQEAKWLRSRNLPLWSLILYSHFLFFFTLSILISVWQHHKCLSSLSVQGFSHFEHWTRQGRTPCFLKKCKEQEFSFVARKFVKSHTS